MMQVLKKSAFFKIQYIIRITGVFFFPGIVKKVSSFVGHYPHAIVRHKIGFEFVIQIQIA